MQNAKRFISVFLAAALLLSVFCASLSFAGAETAQVDYTVEYINDTGAEAMTDEQFAKLGTSLIAGKKADPYTDGENGVHKSMLGNSSNKDNLGDADGRLSGLTDGALGKINEMMTAWGQPIKPLYLEYDLGASCSVKRFFMVGANNGTLNTSAYEVYLADNKDDLYSVASRIYSYDHTKDGIHGGQLVTFSSELKGRFLAVKITKPTIANLNQAGHHARLAEIAVFESTGDGYSVEYVNSMTNQQLAELGTSLIAGKKAAPYTDGENGTLKSMLGNSSNKDNLGDAENRLLGLTDGSTEKINEMMTAWGQPIKPLYLEYDLETPCSVEKFFMMGANNGSLNTSAYELYLSDNKEDLYTEEKRIYTYDHTKDGVSGGQVVTFNTPLTGNYFAVKIIRPTIANLNQAGHHARIFEIALFGSTAESPYTVEYINEADADHMMTNQQLADLGDSLISGKRAAPYAYDKDTNTHKTLLGNASSKENLADADANLTSMTDGKVRREDPNQPKEKVAADLYYGGGAVIPAIDLEYDLGSECLVEKFLLVGMGQINAPYYTGAYDVYLANGQDDLYADENKIYSYNWEKEGAKRGQIVTFKEPKAGRYIAIRILKTYTTASSYNYARISEVAVYGRDTANYTVEYIAEKESDYKTPNMFSNAQFAALGESLLLDATPMMRSNGIVNRTLNDYTGKKLNDGDVENGFNINVWPKATYGDPYMDVIYDLGEDPIEIEKFFFLGFYAPWRHYYTGKYQVFVAEDFDDLFVADNIVYEYDYRSQQISRGQIVTFKKAPVGCYVAIRIIEPNIVEFDRYPNDAWVCPKLSEIAVYGHKAVIEEVPINLAQSKPVNAYLTDASGKTTEISEAKFGAEQATMLTDGERTQDVVFETAGQRLDIVYNLCRDMKVDAIAAFAADGIGSYTVYASTDYNELWKDTSKVTADDAGNIHFSESRSIRYVRVSFEEQQNTVRVSEIEVTGLNRQQLKYKNISRTVVTSGVQLFAQDQKTGEKSYMEIEPDDAAKLFDGDTNSPVGIEGGDPAKDSLNVQVYLGDLKMVDSVELNFFSHVSQYYPGALSLYLGENESDILGENAKPVCSWNYAADSYKATFKPRLARYMRISVTQYTPDDYDTYCIAFTEIKIMGSAVVGTQTARNNDVLLSFKDEPTGIEWEVLRIDTNDILTGVSDSFLETSAVTNKQKASLYDSLYKIQDSRAYAIQFTDRNGNKIDGIGERSIRIKVPVSIASSATETLIGKVEDTTQVQLCETMLSEDDTALYVEWDKDSGRQFVLALPTNAEDSYWNGLVPVKDNTNDNQDGTVDDNTGTDDGTVSQDPADVQDPDTDTDESSDTENNGSQTKPVKKHRRVARIEESYEAWVLPVIIGSCVLGVIAVAVVIILIVRKKKKKAA